MSKTRTRIMPLAFSSATLLIAASLLFTAIPLANASTSTTVNGRLSQGSLQILNTRVENSGNTIIQVNRTDMLTGGIVGTCVDTIPTTVIIHADGSGNIHGKCQGRATLLGRTGTYVEAFSATFQANGVVVGHASLGDGAGGLIGMHGVQSNSSSPDGKTTFYSAQVHFEES